MAQLRREDVLAGALALLEAEGLDALTMRRLATSLDVQAGALYWHFKDKKALVDAMAERLVASVASTGAPSGDGWDQRLTVLATQLRQALLTHRDGARLVAETACTSTIAATLRVGRTSTELLVAAGFPFEQAVWLTFGLIHYVLGQTMGEQARVELAASGALDGPQAAARAAALNADPDKQFAYALGVFIDGIRHQLP